MGGFDEFLLGLYRTDPFAEVRSASKAHRVEHGASLPGGEQECGVYPSDPLKMRAVATIVRAAGARRILEIGGGLGYSALWLARAAGTAGSVETLDRYPEHARQIERFAVQFALAGRVRVVPGEGAAVLSSLAGPYDAIHDDGWFAAQPAYYDRLAQLVRPGGLLVMSNWFLLEHAVTGESPVDWAQFAGPSWSGDVKSYARRLTSDPRWHVSFVQKPSFAIACRTDA
jgi:predicted O-methyltransferase YrrM